MISEQELLIINEGARACMEGKNITDNPYKKDFWQFFIYGNPYSLWELGFKYRIEDKKWMDQVVKDLKAMKEEHLTQLTFIKDTFKEFQKAVVKSF